MTWPPGISAPQPVNESSLTDSSYFWWIVHTFYVVGMKTEFVCIQESFDERSLSFSDIANAKDFLWAKYLLDAEDTEINTSKLSI